MELLNRYDNDADMVPDSDLKSLEERGGHHVKEQVHRVGRQIAKGRNFEALANTDKG